MKPFAPGERLAEHQRAPFADLLRRFVEMRFDPITLAQASEENVATMERVCPDEADHGSLIDELTEWVRWIRAPAYCFTYTYQLLTQRLGIAEHVVAALLFADAQIGIAEDRSLNSIEVAWDSLRRLEGRLESSATGLAPVRAEIIRRLRIHHRFYANWTRPFQYVNCDPLAEHLYNQRVADSLRAAYAEASARLTDDTPPAQRAAVFGEIAGQAHEAGDTYHWLTARRFAAMYAGAIGDHARAQAELGQCVSDARELGLEAEVGHLLRQRAVALTQLGELREAAGELERAGRHEQPIAMFGYWYALTMRELGDVRARRVAERPGDPEAALDGAVAAYGGGRRLLDVVLAGGGPPAGTTIKRQMLRSYTDNSLGVALARDRFADALAEVEASGPRGLGETMAEIRAAAALPAADAEEFLRERELFHRHLTSVPDAFDQYLTELPEQYAARRSYETARHEMRVLGRRGSDEVAARLLAPNGVDLLVLAFFLGPSPTSRALLLDLGDGSIDEQILGPTEEALRRAHAEYIRALAEAAELPDPARAARRGLDGLLATTNHLLAPALEMVAAKAAGRRLIIVPQMQLNAVPLHAVTVGGAPLLDLVRDVAFVPSLGLLADLFEGRDPAAAREAGMTVIHDTAGTPFFAGTVHQLEQTRAVHIVRDPEPEAALDAVKAAAGDDVLFACHGGFDPLHPAASALRIGTGAGLSLSALSGQLALPQSRCVLLGACESGLARAEIASEYIGLAGVLLSAGVRNVVASLWKVGQLGTAILLGDCLRAVGTGAGVPTALADAQRALRALTREDAIGWVTAHVPALLPLLQQRLDELPARPFAHPMDWAGFFAASAG